MKYRKLILWMIMGAIGLGILGLIYGLGTGFFVRGAWWTIIYVVGSAIISLIYCWQVSHEPEDTI